MKLAPINWWGCHFKAKKDQVVVVPAGSIIYVGIELTEQPRDKFLLDVLDHEDIICCIGSF